MTDRAARGAAIAVFAFAATAAHADENQAKGPQPLSAGDARLCFYRETWHALSVQPDVTVNGQVVGKAFPNEWFCVDRKPGTYEVSTVSEPDRKWSVTLESGQTRYASLEFTVTWFLVAHINPELVDNATGAKGIAGLKYHTF
jgi:uncharacterized protein DUF2846